MTTNPHWNPTHCRHCGRGIGPEDGRAVRIAGEHEHWCLSCACAQEARDLRRRMEKGPAQRGTAHTAGYSSAAPPWENPLYYLAATGLRTEWGAWALRHGLLDDWHERPISEQDFGDGDSRAALRLLPRAVEVEGRRVLR